VRGLVFTGDELVANDGPGGFFAHGGVDAEFFEEAFLMRDDDGRAIGEGDDAEFDVGGLG
jgi:hypothetical protein